MKMEPKKVTEAKLARYYEITSKAFDLAKKNVSWKKKKQSKEIIQMVSDYLKDSKYFEKEGHYVNAFAAINYAHGWLDCGARLRIFKVRDNNLFSID